MNSFKKSSFWGTLYHLFLFAYTLICGWLVSALLDSAIESDGGAALRATLYLTTILVIGLPVIYIFRKTLGHFLRSDRQNYREKLYGDIIRHRINVESIGELDVRLSNDADTVAEYYQSSLPSAVEGVGIMLGAALLLCRAHLLLGLLLFALSFLQLLPTVVYEKWAKEIYKQTNDAEENYDSWLIQGCDGLATLKSYKQEDWFAKKLDSISDGMVKAGFRAEKAGTVETIVFQFVDGALRYGSYVIIGLFVLYGGLNVSDTPVIIILSSYLFGSVNSLLDTMQKRFEYQVAKKQLAESPIPELQCTDRALLEVSHIHKTYREEPVLNDVSLSVRDGERVLISGPNGSGKSTLLRIVLGLIPADGGTVFVGTGKIAFAMQEEADITLTGIELLDDLLKEKAVNSNIMQECLCGFEITESILEKPLLEWSMGQRKKFYLASAFARDAELLILDEPTNHLDAKAQEYLYKLIIGYRGAVLAVSHQTDMPVEWDNVVALKGGE